MKRIICVIMLGSIICSSYGQVELKKIQKKDKENSIVENYYVLKNDNNIKQGDYKRFLNSKKINSGHYDKKETG